MKKIQLGQSDLNVTSICLGTMTFGEQVDEQASYKILDRALEKGVDFLDTAEMYSVPTKAETFTATEKIIGNWLSKRPGARNKLTIATKVAGPSRNTPWVRGGKQDLTASDIEAACNDSLKRLQIDVIDLYQMHWPTRNVPMFGGLYYQPINNKPVTSMHEQLDALDKLVKAGKVRAIGLSNETPYGVHEFVSLAEKFNLTKVATVQNPYCLINRVVDNGLDETIDRLGVSLLAYSPLGFGLLTGKYDQSGFTGESAPSNARITKFEAMRQQRWGRVEALDAARRYNHLAKENGMKPSQMALAFCYNTWHVASTIIGVTSVAQLDECLDAWGTTLSDEVITEINKIRWEQRDPAQ